MNKNINSDCVTIGVRVPRSVALAFDEFCEKLSLSRSSCLRLLLSWLRFGASQSALVEFRRFVRNYKSFQQA